MLKAENLKKSYNSKTIFEKASFVLNPGERVGLIGKNGSGKSTLLKIIIGEIEPDEGRIIIEEKEKIGYLPQTIEMDFERTIKEFFILDQGQKIKDWQIEKFLGKLGIYNIDLKRKIKTLSGGEATRIALAKILTKNPSFLLLDEPTNHLDIKSLFYLQKFLSNFKGGILLISHDRWILDKVVTKIIELQLTEKGRTAKIYSGNFSHYQETRQKEIEKQETLYKLQQKRFKAIKEDIERTKQQALKTEKDTIYAYCRARAKKVAKKAKAREKKLQRLLESEEKIEKPQKEKPFWFLLTAFLEKGQRVLAIEDLSFSFNKKPLFSEIDFEIYGKDRIVLLGPNGSGKTTFFKILLGEIKKKVEKIKINPSVKIGYLPQEIIFRDYEKTVLEEFEKGLEMPENEVRRILGKFLFSGEEQMKKLKDLSLGERRRLYLAKIVASGVNFLLLDEPTNHLDIPSIEAVERALSQFGGAIFVISHDRYFLRNIGIEKFYYLEDKKFKEFYSIENLGKIVK